MIPTATPRQSQTRCRLRYPATGTRTCGSGRCCSSAYQRVALKSCTLPQVFRLGAVLTCRQGQLPHQHYTGTRPGRKPSSYRRLGNLKTPRGHGQQQRRGAALQHHLLELARAAEAAERPLDASALEPQLALLRALPARRVSASCTIRYWWIQMPQPQRTHARTHARADTSTIHTVHEPTLQGGAAACS
eukprot:COSAG03_NODE_1893_length_3384_cov_2.707763_1_plen_189_part_00